MEFNIKAVSFERAGLDDINKLLSIIHRCLKEVNSKDYEAFETEKFIADFNYEYLKYIILEIRMNGVWIAGLLKSLLLKAHMNFIIKLDMNIEHILLYLRKMDLLLCTRKSIKGTL